MAVLEINVCTPVMTEWMLLYAFLWITSTNCCIFWLFPFLPPPPPPPDILVSLFLWFFLSISRSRVYTGNFGNFLTNFGGMNMLTIHLNLLTLFQNTLNVLFHFAFVTVKGSPFPSAFSASFWLCLPTLGSLMNQYHVCRLHEIFMW